MTSDLEHAEPSAAGSATPRRATIAGVCVVAPGICVVLPIRPETAVRTAVAGLVVVR